MPSFKDFLFGSPQKYERVSTLLPQQEKLLGNLTSAAGAGGGAFNNAANYYRGLLSDNSADFDAFSRPELRRFNEQIIPDIAEQFAGMGSGALSSSGFQNASVNAGTDLSERLGALRASLRQAGAQGLQNIGQLGLGNYSQSVMTDPGSEGLLSNLAPAIGTGLGALFGGPIGAGIGSNVGSWFGGRGSRVGAKSSPYGNQQTGNPGFQLPSFMQR